MKNVASRNIVYKHTICDSHHELASVRLEGDGPDGVSKLRVIRWGLFGGYNEFTPTWLRAHIFKKNAIERKYSRYTLSITYNISLILLASYFSSIHLSMLLTH